MAYEELRNIYKKQHRKAPQQPPTTKPQQKRKKKNKKVVKRKRRTSQCIATEKVSYKTKVAAQKVLNKLKDKGKARYLRVYLCQFCGYWHLTHHKDKM